MAEESPTNAILQPASIDWSDDGQPLSQTFGDVYFSKLDGLRETEYVFLQHNQLKERWQQLSSPYFTIAETGFGTGLNFLCAAHLWLQCTNNQPDKTLHFISAEKYPLSRQDFEKALRLRPGLEAHEGTDRRSLGEELLADYPPAVPGVHRLHLAKGRIMLTLLYGDAAETYGAIRQTDHPAFSQHNTGLVNAWFLDGFAPAKNPAMWTPELFGHIGELSGAGTTFSTFTAAGIVKRGLQAAGFHVTKVPGFGHKREMLTGQIPATTATVNKEPMTPASARRNAAYEAPWYLTDAKPARPKTAIVIGGGIAGCSTANALARRGIEVTLIERHSQLANEGSGNPQGILYPKLSPRLETLSRFALASLLYASRLYRQHLQKTGVLVLPKSEKEAASFDDIISLYPPELVQKLCGTSLKNIAGVDLNNHCGLYYPTLGWLSPVDVCNALIQHPLITTCTAEVSSLEPTEQGWAVHSESASDVIDAADVVIIACANASNRFAQTKHLPLKAIRGQISEIPATPESNILKTVICGEGYIAPAIESRHTAGASYVMGTMDNSIRTEEHQSNLDQLARTDSALTALLGSPDAGTLSGRAAFRCTTPDYLPIAGPAPKYNDYLSDYALLRKNARSHIPVAGKHWRGLYINCGYGSRGLSYAPLCAEMIACEITGEAPPLERELSSALHPARFIIRGLRRNTL